MTKRYILAGGSTGIGAEIARKLLARGAEVTQLSRTPGSLSGTPGLDWHEADFAQNPTFPAVQGPIHGLIYAPGTILLKPFRGLKDEDFLHDWTVNFLGAVRVLRAYEAGLKEGNGSVVLFSTVAAAVGMPFHASIAAAKSAVEGLTKSLAAEWAPTVRVNAVAPSLTDTPLAAKLLSSPEKVKMAEDRHPLKKVGTPNMLADAALFLLDHPWITGQILPVDGGMSRLKTGA